MGHPERDLRDGLKARRKSNAAGLKALGAMVVGASATMGGFALNPPMAAALAGAATPVAAIALGVVAVGAFAYGGYQIFRSLQNQNHERQHADVLSKHDKRIERLKGGNRPRFMNSTDVNARWSTPWNVGLAVDDITVPPAGVQLEASSHATKDM